MFDISRQTHGDATETSPPSNARGYETSSGERQHLPRAYSLAIIIAQGCNLASIVFLILVFVGNTRNTHPLTDIYFLKIDVSQVVPRSHPNAVLVNAIAKAVGLRDFYQVGLWNYCEGYQSTGVTFCGTPKPLYSFDPMQILVSQLFQGATSQLPFKCRDHDILISQNSSITTENDGCIDGLQAGQPLDVCLLLRWDGLLIPKLLNRPAHSMSHRCQATDVASGWCGNLTRRYSLVVFTLAFIAALFTTAGAVLSTVLYAVFRRVFESAPEFDIRANLGVCMYIFVWLAAGLAMISCSINAAVCSDCCLKSKLGRGKLCSSFPCSLRGGMYVNHREA
jgi:hypothetical protein